MDGAVVIFVNTTKEWTTVYLSHVHFAKWICFLGLIFLQPLRHPTTILVVLKGTNEPNPSYIEIEINSRPWNPEQIFQYIHHDVIKWKHFPRYWPFVRVIHRSPGEFPTQRPMTRSFDVFFDLCLNKRLSKQSWGWWFEMLLSPLWRHCNVIISLNMFNSVIPRRSMIW